MTKVLDFVLFLHSPYELILKIHKNNATQQRKQKYKQMKNCIYTGWFFYWSALTMTKCQTFRIF